MRKALPTGDPKPSSEPCSHTLSHSVEPELSGCQWNVLDINRPDYGRFNWVFRGFLDGGGTCWKKGLADREGFEPSNGFHRYTLSRRAPSTTRPPVRGRAEIHCPAPVAARLARSGARRGLGRGRRSREAQVALGRDDRDGIARHHVEQATSAVMKKKTEVAKPLSSDEFDQRDHEGQHRKRVIENLALECGCALTISTNSSASANSRNRSPSVIRHMSPENIVDGERRAPAAPACRDGRQRRRRTRPGCRGSPRPEASERRSMEFSLFGPRQR